MGKKIIFGQEASEQSDGRGSSGIHPFAPSHVLCQDRSWCQKKG